MLALRSLFFTILVPGTVTVLIPYLIVSWRGGAVPDPWGAPQYLSLVPIGMGVAILLWCIWDFARVGRGTLAPIDPPRALVVQGLYRCVRHPMYVGFLVLLVGEAALFESLALLWYSVGWFVVIHLVVVLYEEPALRRRFGESYDRYCWSVPRWIPGRRSDQAA